ncbi:MAG: gamma-glutamylcyclotransferase family protein [Pseudomonadota bacterium]
MTPRFFGYGSLVNRRTHAYPGAQPLTVRGWRRAWRHTSLRPVAFLTAVPSAGEIDGLAAEVPGADWAALDLREAAYLRAVLPEGPEIYHIPDGLHGPATEAHPILLSYIDVVVQGYLTEFGVAGVARFFETTDGWDAPIRDDRAEPIYPRAQVLAGEERSLVDTWLGRMRKGTMVADTKS